jgi:broad specificity phosphatase PhoE
MKNLLIVSHGGRIRCLLSSLYKVSIDKKFKNAAVLLFRIRYDPDHQKTSIKVILFHDGELWTEETSNKSYAKYYTSDKTNIGNTYFEPMETEVDPRIYGTNDLNIYVTRHAEGFHNLASKLSKVFQPYKYFDPELTPRGESQAERSGKRLRDIHFHMIFISDMYRTKHTLLSMKLGVNTKPVVLPCANEVNQYVEYSTRNPTCDSAWINYIPMMENRSNCVSYAEKVCKHTDQRCIQKKRECTQDTDWEYYLYQGKNESCKTYNMLVHAIQYLSLF